MAVKLLLSIFTASLVYFVMPVRAHAVIQNLNGQTGQQQSIANDSNVGINSAGNIHSIFWTGTLPISRGGTGVSSLTDGSIPFIANGVFSESPNLVWDSVNEGLGVGTSTVEQSAKLHVAGGNMVLDTGYDFVIKSPNQNIRFENDGQNPAQIAYETPEAGNGLFITVMNGMYGVSILDAGKLVLGSYSAGGPSEGTVQIQNEGPANPASLYVGSSDDSPNGQTPGCLVMGDSDGVGVTYITVNDGVMTASATKPSICQ